MSSAIVLLSGGQDSTTSLWWAKKRFKEVICVGYDYGQSHKIELIRAKEIADLAGCQFKVFDVKELLGGSSLTEMTDHNMSSSLNSELPASFTAGRNLLFLTIAASWGANLGINDLVTGVCQTDYSGYPDCRKVTIDAQQLTLSLGLGCGDIRIWTPLMYLNKAETFKLAEELGCLDVVVNMTMTCYNGDMTHNEWGMGCGDCPACRLRKLGYENYKKLI